MTRRRHLRLVVAHRHLLPWGVAYRGWGLTPDRLHQEVAAPAPTPPLPPDVVATLASALADALLADLARATPRLARGKSPIVQ